MKKQNQNEAAPETVDVIIVGAGAGGLAAAARASASGLDVRVFEARSGPGGKIGHETVDGVTFDTGPSLMTMTARVRAFFNACEARMEDELELITHEPTFRYLWPDGAEFEVYQDLADTRASVVKSFGKKASVEFDDFMNYSKRIWEAARPNFIESEAPNITSMFKLGLTKLNQVVKIDPFRTMIQGIERHISEPHLRDVMMRYATYNGSNPFTAPATLNCIAWVEMGEGGVGIRGGMRALPDALERIGKTHGTTYTYDTPISRILVEDGRVVGVETSSGERHYASAVVANADAAHVIETLLPSGTQHDLPANNDLSMSGWTGVLRLHHSDRPKPAHTVLFPKKYDEEFRDIFERDRPPRDPTVYLCDQSASHGIQGWEDASPVFVMANAPCEPANTARSPAVYQALREVVLARLREHDLISARDTLVWERTPTELAAKFPGSRGAIYGAASNSQMAAFKRPPNKVAALPGLYLASGSAHPGGGVPLCIMSGERAAEHLIRDLAKPNHFIRRMP